MQDHVAFLSSVFLFRGLSEEEIRKLTLAHPGRVAAYQKGDTVASPERAGAEVGFLLSGECRIEHPRDGEDLSPMPMNLLKAGDSFGVLTVLSEKAVVPTVIVADKKSEILYFGKDAFLAVMRESPEAALNVSRFLAGRVVFLNEKISAFSGRCADEKLTAYLHCQRQKHGDTFAFSPLTVSKNLNVGRASLYRSLSALEKEGVISRNGKMLTVHREFPSRERNPK